MLFGIRAFNRGPLLVDDRFWPFSADRHYGVRVLVKSNANAWSARMQLTGQ